MKRLLALTGEQISANTLKYSHGPNCNGKKQNTKTTDESQPNLQRVLTLSFPEGSQTKGKEERKEDTEQVLLEVPVFAPELPVVAKAKAKRASRAKPKDEPNEVPKEEPKEEPK